MFTDSNRTPIFFEVYKNRHKFPHMQLECVPLPDESADLAPMYFKVRNYILLVNKTKRSCLTIPLLIDIIYRKLYWNVRPNGLSTKKLLI